MKTLEELYVDLERLQAEVKASIRHDRPDDSYVPVHDEYPPFFYYVHEKTLIELFNVRNQIVNANIMKKMLTSE